MKFRGCLNVLLCTAIVGCGNVFAQSISENERLNQWNLHCDRLKGIPSGEENYPDLIKAAKVGIKMTPANNFLYKSIFAFHLAGGYESTYEIDSAIHYYEISRILAEKAKSNSRIVYALRRLAGLYDNKQLRAAADRVRNQLIEIAKTDQNEEIQVGANIVLGEYYFNAGQFEKALKNYLTYIKYLKIDYAKSNNSGSRSNIGVGYLAIGEIYQNLNRPSESLNYFKEAIDYLSTYREGLETAYKDLVTSYLSLNQVVPAVAYYHKLKLSVAESHDLTVLIDAQVELGRAYMKQNNLGRAENLLTEAGKNAETSKEKEDLYHVKTALGDLSLKKHKTREAIEYYKSVLPLAIYFKNKASIASIYYNLAGAEKENHLDADAFQHILLYAKYTDSLKSESISKNIIEMEARFQNEVKEQKIGLLNQENKLKNTQLKQERSIRWLFAGAALLSLLALILIYLNYRNKRKANLLLNKKNQQLDIINAQLNLANQTKSKLFGMISHDLRGPVGQLFTFLKLQQQKSTLISDADRDKHRENLIRSSSNLLETMEDLLLWSKSQMDNFETDYEEVNLIDAFASVVNLLQSQAEAKQLNLATGELAFEDIQTDYNLLFAILRNVAQNAIRYAHPDTSIVFSTGRDEQDHSFISIWNQGEVIPEDKIKLLLSTTNVNSKSSGYGLMIVKEMADRLGAALQIISNTRGTTVSIHFQ